jgi:hypothetical protein
MHRNSIAAQLRRAARVALGAAALAGAIGWGTLALWFDGPASRVLAGGLAGAFALGAVLLPLVVRRPSRALVALLVAFGLLLGWWFSIAPQNDRDWLPDVARPATAVVHGNVLTIDDLRNFDYHSATDFTERWERRPFDLSRLRGLDLFLSYWGSALIAHTILSWEFDDGRHLAISIETRKERGESYSPVRGFFRQYELYYVVGDERDLIRLRTNYRDERVYLYRLNPPPAMARALLLTYLDQVNRLAREPTWCNALTHNCTTTIRFHVQQMGMRNPWNWRILVNGYVDELLYMRGSVDTSRPFPELKQLSDITERAKAADQDPAFSQRIREGLPPRPTTHLPAPAVPAQGTP